MTITGRLAAAALILAGLTLGACCCNKTCDAPRADDRTAPGPLYAAQDATAGKGVPISAYLVRGTPTKAQQTFETGDLIGIPIHFRAGTNTNNQFLVTAVDENRVTCLLEDGRSIRVTSDEILDDRPGLQSHPSNHGTVDVEFRAKAAADVARRDAVEYEIPFFCVNDIGQSGQPGQPFRNGVFYVRVVR